MFKPKIIAFNMLETLSQPIPSAQDLIDRLESKTLGELGDALISDLRLFGLALAKPVLLRTEPKQLQEILREMIPVMAWDGVSVIPVPAGGSGGDNLQIQVIDAQPQSFTIRIRNVDVYEYASGEFIPEDIDVNLVTQDGRLEWHSPRYAASVELFETANWKRNVDRSRAGKYVACSLGFARITRALKPHFPEIFGTEDA